MMKMKKITKTKTIDGSIWYYSAEADEKEERESPPLSEYQKKILRRSVMDSSVDLADLLMQKDEDEDENSGMTTLMC